MVARMNRERINKLDAFGKSWDESAKRGEAAKLALKARLARRKVGPKTVKPVSVGKINNQLKKCTVESVGARSQRPGDTKTDVLLKCGAQKIKCVMEQGKNPKCKKVNDARNPQVQPE